MRHYLFLRGHPQFACSSELRRVFKKIKHMKTLQEIAADVMTWFEINNSTVGDVLNDRWLRFKYVPSLAPAEEERVTPAINWLAEAGLVSIDEDQVTIRLTERGYEALLSCGCEGR
jgi:hypothetical protein